MMKPILFAPILLGGCATVADTGSETPTASYVSPKSPDAAERCLTERLSYLTGGPAVSRGETATRIAFTSGLYTFLVVAVSPEGAGSRINVHHQQTYPKRVRASIESCV